MKCPYCNTTIGDDETFCPNCGKELPGLICPNCGAQLARGSRFCSQCGANLEKIQESQKIDDYYEGYEASDESPDDDYDWDEESSGRKWLPLILVIVLAAVVVILIAAWRLGMLDNLSGGRSEEEAVEKVIEEEEEEHDYYLNFVTQVLDFSEPGLTQRIEFDTDIENQSEIEWTSSDPSVAKVDVNGYVTSVGSGRAIITAEWGDLSAACSVACDYTSTAAAAGNAADRNDTERPEDEEEDEAETEEAEGAASTGDYLCSYSSDRLITQADMTVLAASDYGTLPAGKSLAQMMINEIYARHGYLFQTAEIQQYFDQKPWYQNLASYSADADVIVQRFNEIEKQNVEFLNNY